MFYTRKWKWGLKFLPGKKGKLGAKAEEEISWLVQQLAAYRYLPLVVDARYAYPIREDIVAGDASSSYGWGVCVGPYIAFGRWADETLEALARVKDVEESTDGEGRVVLSISPAELFVVNLVLLTVNRVARAQLQGMKQFVAKCDNSSACNAVNHRRVKSIPMHTSLTMIA